MLAIAGSQCLAQSSQDTTKPADQKDDNKSQKEAQKEKDDDAAFHNLRGINDISAIGERNVGCDRGFANWYSLDKQVAMGREFARQVDESSRLITDARVNEYVNRIGQNLVRSSDSKLPFTIKVLDAEEPNAFTLPGGYMYVNSGALLLAENESELAGVMAHEIGHVAACHAARGATRGALTQLAMIPLIFVGGPLVQIGMSEVMGLAVPAVFMKFSRGFEAQADYLGIQYAYKAGYDPLGMINFFEKLEALDKKRHGMISNARASHPQTADRVEKSQHEIASILPPRDQYIIDTSEFQDIKARLIAIQNHRKLKDDKDGDRPGLRRTTNAPGSSDKKDDDRPTAKRNPSGDHQ